MFVLRLQGIYHCIIHTVKPAQQSTDTLPATLASPISVTSPSLPASGEAFPVTLPLTTDEVTAEIPADVAVVRNLKELEIILVEC